MNSRSNRRRPSLRRLTADSSRHRAVDTLSLRKWGTFTRVSELSEVKIRREFASVRSDLTSDKRGQKGGEKFHLDDSSSFGCPK